MGSQCATAKPACLQTSRKKRPTHEELPADLSRYSPENLNYRLSKIQFEAEIYNIQITDYTHTDRRQEKPKANVYSINFHVHDVISISLPEKEMVWKSGSSSDSRRSESFSQIKWKIKEKFGFLLTQYEIRTKFLVVEVMGANKAKVDELRVNLYTIATGPQHHDFEVGLRGKSYARLKFDFKISEVVETNLDFQKLKINFEKNYEDQKLEYSIKVMTNNDVIGFCSSPEARTVCVDTTKDRYREVGPDDEPMSPLKVRKRTSSTKFVENELSSFVEWGSPSDQLHEGQEPEPISRVTTKLLSNQINKTFLQCVVWKVESSVETGLESKNYKRISGKFFAGSVVNFSKIFDRPHDDTTFYLEEEEDSPNDDLSTHNTSWKLRKKNPSPLKVRFDIEKRNVILEEVLLDDGGAPVGKCHFEFTISNCQFERQLQACARTEEGVINMTFLFKGYLGSKDHLKVNNQNTQKVIEKYEEIEGLMKVVSDLSSDSYGNRSEIMRIEDDVEDIFKDIAAVIRDSLKESFCIVSQSSGKKFRQLLDNQTFFLDFLNKIYFYLSDDTIYSDLCWEIAFYIFKRGEFYLENIGFIHSGRQSEEYERKLGIALKYQNVLYKFCVQAMRDSALGFSGNRNPHTEAYKAYCYVKIPIFRERLLKSIQKSYDQDVIEWKLQQVEEQTSDLSSQLKVHQDRFALNLDWEQYFYQEIKESEENIQIQKELLEEVEHCPWIESLGRREEGFFEFTARLMKKLNEITERVKVSRWHYFPGYSKIIRSFLVEMKKRPLADYSSLLVRTSAQLLANEELINILMPIVVEKANIYSKADVVKCLEILESFFLSLTDSQTRPFPRGLNYMYFFKTSKLLLEKVDSVEPLVKYLILLYDFYEWLSPECRDNLTMFLLGKVFFKLFFHWSYQVRVIFYNLLIIKIYYVRIQKIPSKERRPSNLQVQMNTKISERYRDVSKILINSELLKKEENLDFRIIYEKELYKKMKNKHKRRVVANLISKNQKEFSKGAVQPCEANLYSLQNLMHPKKSRRSSFPNDDLLRNRSATNFEFRTIQEQPVRKEEPLEIVKGNSFCVDISTVEETLKNTHKFSVPPEDENSLQDLLESKLQGPSQIGGTVSDRMIRPKLSIDVSKQERFNYSMFNEEDHALCDPTLSEANYILKGVSEYRETLNEINECHQKTGELPKRELNYGDFLFSKRQNE